MTRIRKGTKRQEVQIRHIDGVRHLVRKPDGWYRVPSFDGLEWVYYKDNYIHTSVIGTLHDSGMYEVWSGDRDGNTDTISNHRKYNRAEEAAEKWIRAHPNGWV